MASIAIAPPVRAAIRGPGLFIVHLVLLVRIGLVLCEKKIYYKNNGQGRRHYYAYDYPCRAAYMYLFVKFSDQNAVGQKTYGENHGHNELDSFKHICTS